MVELTEDGARIVEALVGGPVAWQSPDELASALDRGVEETLDLLATLDAGGWLSAWERGRDVVVTLSVAGASRLGVRLVEVGQEEVPRWARRGELEPPRPKAPGVFRGDRAARLELVVDPSSTPEEMAVRAEAALARSRIPSDPRERAFVDGLPVPTLVVGTGLTPWPGPSDGRKASCPCCRSRRLRPSMYCLYCDRWGLDHLLRDEPAPRAGLARDAKEEAHRRELDRQARKSKRRARRFAQSKAGPRPAGRRRRAVP